MRLALFGGTFDPIHNAHLTVAREAADKFHLDQVWFVPAAHPPHKSDQTGASYEDRCKMVELACDGDPRLVMSRLESGAKKSYSIDTIERVRASGEEPYFIIGADAYAEIASWHRWQDLVRMTEFIVVTRPGHQYSAPPERGSIAWKPSRSPFRLPRSGASLQRAIYPRNCRWKWANTSPKRVCTTFRAMQAVPSAIRNAPVMHL